jgi:hypothetical protein
LRRVVGNCCHDDSLLLHRQERAGRSVVKGGWGSAGGGCGPASSV